MDCKAGVLETAWQPGRGTHEGHAEFKVTVYWRLGGIRGGTGEPYSGGAAGMHGGTGVSRRPL